MRCDMGMQMVSVFTAFRSGIKGVRKYLQR